MTMTPETLAALRGSIAKWEAIVAGTGSDKGSTNCPLCVLFYDVADPDDDEHGLENCSGCPVRIETGDDNCGGSPYKSWSRLLRPSIRFSEAGAFADTPKKIAAAQAELDFLRGLLPKEQPST